MKSKEFILKHAVTLMVVITLVFIGLLIRWVRTVSDEAIIESTFDEMDQIGKQYQILLASVLEDSADDLSLFAKSIAKNNIDDENVVEYLNSQAYADEFDNFHYIDLEGKGVSADGTYRDFSENKSFLQALQDKIYVENPYISLETSELIFNLAVPVIKGNKPIAVLYCEVPVNNFFETVISNKDYEGDIFFVDNQLNMIFSTSSNHIGAFSIPEKDVMEMGIDNVVQAQNNITSKQNGGFYYDYFGTPKVMVYYPLELTSVALALNVHVDSLSSEIISASKNFNVVGNIVYWTVVLLVLYISVTESRSKKRILKVAYYDPLTDLPNMAKFKIEIESVLKNNKDKDYTILIIDIENFKAINEIFGYETGDRVLKAVKTFSDTLNEPSLITARINADSFAMFAESFVLEDLETFFVRVMEFYDRVLPELKDYAGTYKIGRYKIDKEDTDPDEVISKAGLAHSKAKETKGEVLCDYDYTFKKAMQVEAEIRNKMYLALKNREFRPFLQPKFSISENKLIGAEALVRWIEADNKMIFPNDFIPIFERNGFIVELDKDILEQVCMTLRSWMDKDLSIIPISVNCSRLNLQSPVFVSTVVAMADKYNIPHEYIEIELTESTTIESELTIEQLFEDLRKEGFRVSIDDFGAGYSSLGMLKNLQVETLKLDRSFFVGGKNARRNDMLIDSIVKMAHNLKMYVVAEGIETADQVELLKSMNCDAVQGYFYDRPIPIKQFEEKYHSVMVKNDKNNTVCTPLIDRINDIKFASSLVTCGIIVTKVDEYLTLLEANDYYFEMIGYTREEIRDAFNNRGIAFMKHENPKELCLYIKQQMQTAPSTLIEFCTQLMLKSGEIHTVKLSGKVAIDENGEALLYSSVSDMGGNSVL